MKEKKVEINIRLTENEKKKIQRNAKKCKLSLSAYIRKVGLKEQIKMDFLKIYNSKPSGENENGDN